MTRFDVCILGAGPAGTEAARLLAEGGKTVALVEDTHMGGTCLNCGCIPTKMLLGAAAPLGLLKAQSRLRVEKGSIDIDFTALQSRIKRFTEGSSRTVDKNLQALGVHVIHGHGVCKAPGTIVVQDADDGEISAEHILLACGSTSAAFPGLVPDNDCVLDSTALLNVSSVPESLIIVGAGAIGLELGDFFNAAGSQVTIVEAAPHIAPLEDSDVAAEMNRALKKNKITCIEGVKAQNLCTKDGHAELTLADGRVLTAAKALVAVGRRPCTADLGAEALGCALDKRGFVQVDGFLTAADKVYTAGDINGHVLLAHAASHQAAYIARRILGRTKAPYVPGPVPSCYYGSTEIMRVGENAASLLRAGKSVEVSQAPLSINAIAQASGCTNGFVKVVWSEGKIAGITAVGAGVSHLVTAAQLLLLTDGTAEHLDAFMFAHPTLDEILPKAILAKRIATSEA